METGKRGNDVQKSKQRIEAKPEVKSLVIISKMAKRSEKEIKTNIRQLQQKQR